MSFLNRNLPTWERLLRLLAAVALGVGAWALMLRARSAGLERALGQLQRLIIASLAPSVSHFVQNSCGHIGR